MAISEIEKENFKGVVLLIVNIRTCYWVRALSSFKPSRGLKPISIKRHEYLDMLNSIYGKKVVNSLVDLPNDTIIKLKDSKKMNEFIETYVRSEDEGCQDCKELFLKDSFSERKMDFPSWLGLLDFKIKHVKQIMMIGEDVSPKIRKVINITYGLGRYEIMPNGKIKEERGNDLWVCLNKLFDNKLYLVTKNVYMTDICKCNARKNKKIWEKCSKKFLLKEIELINPKIIIFQGCKAYDYTKSILKNRMKEEDITSYFRDNTFPKFGKISLLNNEEINFLKIYHTSRANRRYRDKNRDEYKKLIKNKILPLINVVKQ